MFRKSGDLSSSSFPFSNPAGAPSAYEEFLVSLESLFNGDDAEVFFDAIENTPVRWQRKPELMLLKAVGLLRAGELDDAREVLDEIERSHPKFAPVYFYKASLYMQDIFPAHVLRMMNKVHALGKMDDEAEGVMQEMDKVSHTLISETASELGVSYEQMEKASWFHEAAQEKLNAGQLVSAEQSAREALMLVPNWSSPRNNRSYMLYFLGRTSEALAEANVVLCQQPDNIHTLKNLVIFHAGLGEDEKAHEISVKMAGQLGNLIPDSVEMDMVISALGLVNNDESLWDIAQKYLTRNYEDLFDESWYTLGISAIHCGHLKEAAKLLEKCEEDFEPAQILAIDVRKAMKLGRKLPFAPVYSVVGLLLHASVIEDLVEIIGNCSFEDKLPRHIQKKLDEYIQKRPFVVNGLLRIMSDPKAPDAIPAMLLFLNRPDVDARLLAFALGNVGTNQQRLHILSAMAQAGRDVPPSPIRFWNDETGEWMDVDFTAQMLSDDIELNISPIAASWAEKAQEAKTDADKIAYWRKAVEADPKSGYAVHMLGILLIQTGKKEEGKKLARRAIEVDPSYMFAYANLGLMEAQGENPNIELAMEYLNKVTKASVITTQTAFLMHYALMLLAVDRGDFIAASSEYKIAVELRPDDPILEGWEERLSLGEKLFGASNWLADWQKKSRERTYARQMKTRLEFDTDSRTTLNSLTRDVLGTVARIWGLTSYGKKAELINAIAESMADEHAVNYVLDKLTDAEKNALRWVLGNNAARSWKEFTEKYGDDSEESPYWNYHAPETIIGRLCQTGLLAKGTLNEGQSVFIPADARNLLKTLL